jgi:16S rRNA (cytosine967-C5)-methyltransferase
VRLKDAGAVSELPGFNAQFERPGPSGAEPFSAWWVQNLAASLPARLIPRGAAEVLDLCAAPGGKTMQLAAAGHCVTAIDRSEGRLERLRENLNRTGLAARLVAADAFEWRADRPFDAILLDAPCSATGTFRRHPEVLYRARSEIIRNSAQLQHRLLARAASWLEPGGALVFSVCSLEPEEGETVISRFLEEHPGFRIIPPAAGELPEFVTPLSTGWVRILPGLLESEGGADGFFVARLVRTAT